LTADRGISTQDADWLPDGDILVSGADMMSSCPIPGGTRTLANVWRLDMSGLAMSGSPRPLLSTSCETGKDFIYNVRSAPDGSRFAYDAVQGQFGASIWVADIDGGNDRQLAAATATRAFGRSSWSWSGRTIITDRLERDDTSPFGLYGHIDTIDVTTGTRHTDIPATGAYDALAPSSAEPADTTAPVVHSTADRPPDRNGWYNHPAVITWSPADEDDPLAALTVPAPTTAATEGKDVVSASDPSCDPAGNCATGTVTLSLDSTPPETTVAAPSAWANTDVVLQFAAQDNLSGVDTTSHTVDGGPVTTSSTAETSAEGEHTVSFWSTDRAGNVESVRTATVKIDKGAPAITYTLSPPANASGWNNSPVTATFTCSDSLSGIATCSSPVSIAQDGANQSVIATAADNAGNQTTITINNINIDTARPTIQPIAFSLNPNRVNDTTTMTVTAADSLSGIAGGEYYVGTDPGIGSATPMTLSGNSLTATISGLTAGLYSVGVRARDAAGNWSNTTTDTLVVYDPSGGFATAAGRIVPSGPTSNPGDALPGLDHTSAATIHFEMKYRASGSTPTGDLAFTYRAGSFDLELAGLDWLVVNGSLAIAQGTATIGGQTSVFPFRLTATSTSPSGHVLLRVYPAGANPSSSTPIYQASGDVLGRLMIHS